MRHAILSKRVACLYSDRWRNWGRFVVWDIYVACTLLDLKCIYVVSSKHANEPVFTEMKYEYRSVMKILIKINLMLLNMFLYT